jgi:hypothetical protein
MIDVSKIDHCRIHPGISSLATFGAPGRGYRSGGFGDLLFGD